MNAGGEWYGSTHTISLKIDGNNFSLPNSRRWPMSQNLSLQSDNNLNLLPSRMYSKRVVKTDNSKVLLQNCFFLGSRVDTTFWKAEERKMCFPLIEVIISCNLQIRSCGLRGVNSDLHKVWQGVNDRARIQIQIFIFP